MGVIRFFVYLFLLLLSSVSFASEIDLETGLVAHYKFDGDFNDSSGTGNHGAQQGGVTFVEGIDGQAAYFDGNDDYIIVPHSDSLALNRNLTLSVRLRAEQRNVENCFYSHNGCPFPILIKDAHFPNNFSLWSKFQLESFWFQQYRQSSSGQETFPVEASLFSENYITIAVVRTEGEVVIYLEGEEVQRFNADYDAVQRSGPLYIGYDGGWGYGKYKGVIDDLKIYDRALSDSEVIGLATSPIKFSQDNGDIGLSGIGTQYDIENTLNGNMSFSEDTLTVTNTSGTVDSVRSIHSITSGKHYWEVTAHCGPDSLGFETGVIAAGSQLKGIGYSHNADIWAILSDGAMKNSPYHQVMTEGFLQTYEDDTFQVAVDMDNNKIYYGKNGLWLGGADPELSLNPAADDLSDEVYVFFWLGDRECSTLSATTNFGATQFKYDVPAGYYKGFCPTGGCLISGQESDEQAPINSNDIEDLDINTDGTSPTNDDTDSDYHNDTLDLGSFERGYFVDRYLDPLELQNLFTLSDRNTSIVDDYLAVEQGGSTNEIIYRIPVSNENGSSLDGYFRVEIEMIEQRNFGSLDKDFLTGISDGENVIVFTNNDSSNGGAWIGKDLGDSITETSRVGFGSNLEHYSLLFEWVEGQAELTVKAISGESEGYIQSSLIGSPGEIDLSKSLDLVLVVNESDEDYGLKGINIIYPDSDMDGLTDIEESNLGTSPTNDDTDRDTLHDGWEVENGRNPLVADYQISSGDRHACAIILGEIECWGYNSHGQSNAPDLNNPVFIAAGYDHNCALHDEGVTCWGSNSYGQTNVPQLENPVDIAAGGYHSCALDDKRVVCWGRNSYGQTNVPDLSNPIAIETGLNHTCAIDDTGAVCWGSNSDGQISVPLINNPISLSLGFFHSCALTEDEVICWGRNSDGQTDVPILQSPKLVDADGYFTCAIDDNGIVCWGEDTNGQTNSPSLDATDISSGGHFSCALTEIAVECWGRSTFGELDVPSELTELGSNSFIGQNDEVTAPGNTIDHIDTDNDGLADDFDTDDEADGIYEGQNFSLESLKANFLSPYRPLVHDNDQLEIGTSENSPYQEILWRIPVLDNDNLDDSDKFTVTIEIEEVRVPGLDRDFIVGISDGSKVVNFANAGLGYTGIWIADDMVDRLSHTLVNSNNFGDDHTYYSATFAFTDNTCHLTFTDLISNNQSEHLIQLESGTFDRSKGLELVLIGNEADENFVIKALSITYPDIDSDGDGIFNLDDTDDDNDGTIDEFDAFPLNPQEQMDTDSDGIGNNADTDADNDGIMNEVDSFPYDAYESADSDGDGVGDNADLFPNSAEYSLDSDLDQMPDTWERKYGLNPTDASDALLDQDNDGMTALEEFEAGTIPLKILDIDANGSFDALSDGLIILRYAFGLRGDNLITGAISENAMRTEVADIEAYIESLIPGI